MERASGVLMHITSLPNKQGIGTMGKSAYDFVDFLKEAGQTFWQILPLGTTSYGDSPYQSFSAYAGNTHLIDFEFLEEAGYLQASDYKDVNFGDNPLVVDYGRIFEKRRPILEKAVKNFLQDKPSLEYQAFLDKSQSWLEPFVEYMAIKEANGNRPWYEWEDGLRLRDEEVLSKTLKNLESQMDYHRVTQYFFDVQWRALKAYAGKNNIQIIGDLPIYVSRDSVEMWTQPELFKTDDDLNPEFVAGCPPDAFTELGQLWGNPIYDWDYMEEDGYSWWIDRLRHSFELYDYVRIDHFRGFESYWQIPAEDEDARGGKWLKGPGLKLFDAIKKELGEVKIIAEDLGFMTQEVIDMRDATGFPGMRILQFAFGGHDSVDLPHNYIENCICYTGTHDNETALGWFNDSASPGEKKRCLDYVNPLPDESISRAMNRAIAASVSRTAIYTMQDLLELDNVGRMNTPSTLGGNWAWRMKEGAITKELTEDLYNLTKTYFRLNSKNF